MSEADICYLQINIGKVEWLPQGHAFQMNEPELKLWFSDFRV